MDKTLYSFIGNSGNFSSACADKFKNLYFPLGNERLMSSITSDLHGDIKSGQDAFLLPPVSRIDLVNQRSTRNFWVYCIKNKGDGSPKRTVPFSSVWSATGVSKNLKQIKQDKFVLEAGMLWQKITRQNNSIGLKAEILSFVPAGSEPVEIMQVKLTNISNKQMSFIPTAAIPMYCRGANSIRDHRHVTSLLQRITRHKFGVISKPTLLFDEAGHRINKDQYFVLGWDQDYNPAQKIYPTQEIFCGDSGDLETPEAVFKNITEQLNNIQGKEPMGGLSFKQVCLKPRQSRTYTVIMGIAQDAAEITKIISKFNRPEKVANAWAKTKDSWSKLSQGFNVVTGDGDFDNWLRWVNIQPTLRKIFGCSFLPDHDYGKGGRGWRDLWQDCLGLIFSDPQKVRPLLISSFSGVKIDGSNATIIGKRSGEFIADRNNISRVWMDHGIWPLITLDLYINETGDIDILFEQANYFCNHEIKRAKEINYSWTCEYGNKLKTIKNKVYRGTILEHLLVENLIQFFNVGSHNHIRLEGADWNDGLDMAGEFGESVSFSAMYAQNLETLSRLLLKSGKKKVEVAVELQVLLKKLNYERISDKHKLLEEYFSLVSKGISGRKVYLDVMKLAKDLEAKSIWIKEHIRNTEWLWLSEAKPRPSGQWLKVGFFNGYYDNRKHRLEGKKGDRLQMTLTGQVFPIMSGLAQEWQVQKILQSVNKYLVDKQTQGIHLNTDFKKEQLNLGRAFSFAYGEKENGAVFSHMVVMYAYALYKQGYADAAWKALSSLYKMATHTAYSKIYPCLPEYFNLEGRGMYAYLTGSASWFVFTMLTQVFGVRGQNGDLVIEPKLSLEHFCKNSCISIERVFANRRIKIKFFNPKKAGFGKYQILKILLNSENLPIDKSRYLIITREVIIGLPADKLNLIEIHLG